MPAEWMPPDWMPRVQPKARPQDRGCRSHLGARGNGRTDAKLRTNLAANAARALRRRRLSCRRRAATGRSLPQRGLVWRSVQRLAQLTQTADKQLPDATKTRRQGDKEMGRHNWDVFLLASPSPCLLVCSSRAQRERTISMATTTAASATICVSRRESAWHPCQRARDQSSWINYER
jgi:hypothetical protein